MKRRRSTWARTSRCTAHFRPPIWPTLLALLDAARVAGRGGAGFDFATKLAGADRPPAHGHRQRQSESEPASLKDRTLLRRAPHLVLDGALTVAAAIGATRVVVALTDRASATAVEPRDRRTVRRADRTVHVVDSRGFVSGEARAIVRAVGGGPALPPGPPRPRHPDRHAALECRDVRAGGRADATGGAPLRRDRHPGRTGHHPAHDQRRGRAPRGGRDPDRHPALDHPGRSRRPLRPGRGDHRRLPRHLGLPTIPRLLGYRAPASPRPGPVSARAC